MPHHSPPRLELIDRIAALVPPPRVHRHRYHGVLAPNSPPRAQVTALFRKAAFQDCFRQTDCLILAGCQSRELPLHTFDKRLAKLAGAHRVKVDSG